MASPSPRFRVSQGAIKMSAGAAVSLEAQLGKDPLSSSFGMLAEIGFLWFRPVGFSFLLTVG